MRELEKIIKKYIINYPVVELMDVVKLIYQNEFGPGHAVEYGEAAYDRILSEAIDAKAIARPSILTMPIGNDLARVHNVLFLELFKDNLLAAKVLAAMFSVTAGLLKGDFHSFTDKIDMLLGLIKEDELSGNNEYMFKDWLYNYEESLEEIDMYIKNGYPAPRHSEDYRHMYHPCYRVVYQEFMEYVELFKVIEQPLPFDRKVIIGLDGRAGAGKTTLAKILTHVYGGNFISMDDFYLPLSMRTMERMKEPGGHIHFERFIEQVNKPIKARKTRITYEKYNCQTGETTPVTINLGDKVTVIEGSYSTHPWVRDLYTHTAFLDITDSSQKKRLLKRNGKEGYEVMKNKWIPLENKYHKAFGVDKYANIVI